MGNEWENGKSKQLPKLDTSYSLLVIAPKRSVSDLSFREVNY